MSQQLDLASAGDQSTSTENPGQTSTSTETQNQTTSATSGFHNGDEINQWFTNSTGSGFVDWFNASQAKKGTWAGLMIGGANASERFVQIWDNLGVIYGRDSVNLSEVLVLTSIIINETGGSLTPLSEKVGTAGHPGIAYAFDAIPKLKRSYNAAPWTALASFNDEAFIESHGSKALGDQLQRTQDAVWSGTAYPQDRFPTSTDPATTGFILEADFYKFRGRGLIQTTFRAGYAPIIGFVQTYSGPSEVVGEFRDAWQDMGTDEVANRSCNEDWDKLFQDSGYVVPCVAIHMHNQGAGNYLTVSDERDTLAGTGPGSAYNAGKRVSGGDAYAAKFKGRVLQLFDALQAG
jgi:hypothetical protein